MWLRILLISIVALGFTASDAIAQYDPCEIPPGIYRTQTQGGWGSTCPHRNPGCLRDAYFDSVFTIGLTVGGIFTIHMTSSKAVNDFLPAGSTADVLTSNHINPTSTEAGVFGGQVVALAISLGFSDWGVPTFGDLGSLHIRTGVHTPYGPFARWTVREVFELANIVLGGNTAALPAGISISNLNSVVDSINNDFVDGDQSNGYLVEAECCERWVERGEHLCLMFGEDGRNGEGIEGISVCWCCPEAGQPVFSYVPGCDHGLPGCDDPCTPYYGDLFWTEAVFVPSDSCDDLGGHWTTTFYIEDDPNFEEGCVCVFFEYQLPVELTALDATAGDRQVTLNWTTASEQDNDYFSILRNGIEIAQVDGAGNSQTALNYEYIDRAVVNGMTYTYRLVSRDINGTVHEHEQTVEATPVAPMPTKYALDQNYPNPFNPETSISYNIAKAGFVTLRVYNLLGQEIAKLVEKELSPGRYTAVFTAKDLPSGIYVYRLEVNDFTAQKKMILLK